MVEIQGLNSWMEWSTPSFGSFAYVNSGTTNYPFKGRNKTLEEHDFYSAVSKWWLFVVLQLNLFRTIQTT